MSSQKSNVITESWYLQHLVAKEDENDPRSKTVLYPFYKPIAAEELVDCLLVFMESSEIKNT
jgi:hypothetical protein